MNRNLATEVYIGDVLRLVLPLNAKVMGAAGEARRSIEWVVVLSSWEDLEEQAKTGDLVIVPRHLQGDVRGKALVEALQTLDELGIAGMIVFEDVPAQAAELTHKLNLPLVIAPDNASVREVQQAIAALLVDRQTAASERAMQLYRRLSEMSREGQGLQAMTDVMGNLTGNIVVVQDKRLDIRAEYWPSDIAVDKDEVRHAVSQREHLPAVLRNRKAAAKARQSYWQQIMPVENLGRLISPIISGDRARGYLSILGPAESLDLLDSLTVEHGAAACALEMAKAKAVSEVKKALRGDFLEGLLAGTLPEREISRLASRLDHNTQEPHAILTLAWMEEGERPSLRRLETTVNWLLSNHPRPALVHAYGNQHLCVFQMLNDPQDMESAHELARRLREQVEAEFPNARLIGGMSGPAMELEDWPAYYRQALQSMDVGKRLNLSNQIVEFNSLGVYQLLCELEELPHVQQFAGQIIGPLAQYDEDHKGSLVKTLDAYFAHHGNVSQTAESLFVHRNTLLYRMERIQELTGQDLDNSDMRLALHLSLKLWQLRPETDI